MTALGHKLANLGIERRVPAGQILFARGDASDSVYFVVEGSFTVGHSTDEGELVVGSVGPGQVVGEITAVIGGRRTATVRTGSAPALVRELSAEEYADFLIDEPAEAQRISGQARDRLDHLRVARVLTDLIGPGHREVVDDVNSLLEWKRIEAGNRLFAQGDQADAAYIVVTGRLQLTATDAAGATTLDVSIGRGDIVGELGIIEQAPRSATATATRDTTLAQLSEAAFESLTAKHPKLMLQVFRKILTRVMRPSHRPPHAGLIAVAVLSPAAEPGLVAKLATEIKRHGPALYLDREQVGRFFHRRGIANAHEPNTCGASDNGVTNASARTAEHARLDEFLSEADVAHRWVVLETDPTLTTWTSRALRSADRVLLVTSPFPDDRERQLVREFTEVVDGVADRELWIVQANGASINRPIVNRSIIKIARPQRILQLHRGIASSAARIARLASGTATGVAMSGGGGRAFAQIGAARALTEAGYTIDVLTGTSMGSVVAGSLAYVEDPNALAEYLETGFRGANIVDYTLPVVSLASGKGLTAAIEHTCGPVRIEELTLPFSCLSTNLTTASLVEHRTGRVADALRASVSLPGVFPPVVVNGDLLVDGGVMENLPVGPLVRDPAVSTVIAIDVAPPTGPSSLVEYGGGVSGPRALRNQMSRHRTSYPGLANTVMASMLLSSARARNQAIENEQIDLYLSLNLKGVKLLDFEAISAVAERGYQATIDRLESIAAPTLS